MLHSYKLTVFASLMTFMLCACTSGCKKSEKVKTDPPAMNENTENSVQAAESVSENANAPSEPVQNKTEETEKSVQPSESVSENANAPSEPVQNKTEETENSVQAAESVSENANAPSEPVQNMPDKTAAYEIKICGKPNESPKFTSYESTRKYAANHKSFVTITNPDIDWKNIESKLTTPIFKTDNTPDAVQKAVEYINKTLKDYSCHESEKMSRDQFSAQLIRCEENHMAEAENCIGGCMFERADFKENIYMVLTGSKDDKIRTYLIEKDYRILDGEEGNTVYSTDISIVSLSAKSFLNQNALYARVKYEHSSDAEHMGSDKTIDTYYKTYLFAGEKLRLLQAWTDTHVHDFQGEEQFEVDDPDIDIMSCTTADGDYEETRVSFDGVEFHSDTVVIETEEEMNALMKANPE